MFRHKKSWWADLASYAPPSFLKNSESAANFIYVFVNLNLTNNGFGITNPTIRFDRIPSKFIRADWILQECIGNPMRKSHRIHSVVGFDRILPDRSDGIEFFENYPRIFNPKWNVCLVKIRGISTILQKFYRNSTVENIYWFQQSNIIGNSSESDRRIR
jgi:hypothetical protein